MNLCLSQGCLIALKRSLPPLLVAVATACAVGAVDAADIAEVLFDGTRVAEWVTGRDAERLRREFSVSDLSPLQQPSALLWRFVPKEARFNDVFLRKPLMGQFRTIRVRLRNRGEAFDLAAKVGDAGGAEWTVPPVRLDSGGDWRWIEFPREQWKVAGWSRDANGQLDFPLPYFALIAFNVGQGREYRLEVQRVEAVSAALPLATLHELDLPEKLSAGGEFNLSFSATFDKPCRRNDAMLVFQRGGETWFGAMLSLPGSLNKLTPNQRHTFTNLAVRLSDFATGGKFNPALKLGEAQVQWDGPSAPPSVEVLQLRTPGSTRAEVKSHHGKPTLFINGQPHSGMTWATYEGKREPYLDFTRAGIDLFSFCGTPTEAGYGLSRTTWVGPGRFDYSEFDQRVFTLLAANSNACFFPRLYLHAPKWWSDLHPDDLVLRDPGDGRPVPFIHELGLPAPSWLSQSWRQDTIEALRRMIAHIEASAYADRIIGYHLSSGTTEEWMMWGANENEWVDYSPANTTAFRQWLRDKYGTDHALQEAWRRPDSTLATASIPTKAQRESCALGALRDPAREQAVIDFYLFNSSLVAETINSLAKAVKDLTRREKIVGVFYGYLLQLCGEQRQQNAGHLALEKIVSSPDVDFLCSPTSYAFRQLGGEGTSHFMSLLGSVQLHGKLWFDENDIRTSLSQGAVGEWGRPSDIEGDILQQDKELANCLVNGAAQWWFDVGGNKYNHPALMGRIKELAANAGESLALDRTAADQAAYVVDEQSLCYLRVGDPLGNWLLVGQIPALHRFGAPVGHYLANDLPRLADHKLFFFPTSFAPTAADRRAIDSLKRDGHVLVFFSTPGLYRDGQLDESAMKELTGINLKLSRESAKIRVTLKDGHQLTDGLAGQTYGPDHRTGPIACADDPTVKVLGILEDGRPGLVLKDHGTWTAVHTVAPLLPASLLRRLAEQAGVHIYLDTEDTVWASGQMIAVSVNKGGPRTLHLPRAASVRDLYQGSEVVKHVRSFQTDFTARASRVFVLE